MTLLVRDAQDILRENLQFHLRQGVDLFIITDNCSVDGTADIVREYAERGLAELIWEPQDDYSQACWVTRMARRAATHHLADWVINNDDDEFWSAATGDLKSVLAQVPSGCDALMVERRNHPPLEGGEGRPFSETMVYRERRSLSPLGRPLPPKVCHRALAEIEVSQGNHGASRSGTPLDARPTSALAISHFPMRDFQSFERKIANGGAAYARNTELGPEVGATWRALHALWLQGGLRDWFEARRLTRAMVAEGLADGSLVRDDSVARALRASEAV